MRIKERLQLLQILPSQGSISEMVDVYDLARELKLSDEEKQTINYKEDDNRVVWDYEKDPNKEIKMSTDQYKIIMDTLDKLDKQKQISISMIELILELKDYGKYLETSTTHS